MKNRVLKNLSILAVNIAILSFAGKWVADNVQMADLAGSLSRVSTVSVVAVSAINILVLLLFAVRLAVLIECRLLVAFNVASLGAGLNGVLPFRLGDVARVFYSKRFYRISATQLFAASFTEKLFDLVALGCMVLAIVVAGGSKLIGVSLLLTLAVMIAIGFLGLFFILKYAHHIGRLVNASHFFRTVISSLQHHVRIKRKGAVAAATVMMWLLNLAVVYAGLNWFLPSVNARILDAVVVLLIVALAIAVPGAPAGLGIFEAGVVSYLTFTFQVGNEEALAAALLLHLSISLLPMIISLAIILKPRRKLPG